MKKLLGAVSALAFLAMACPSQSQTHDRETKRALAGVIGEVISDEIGEPFTITRLWGYVNGDQSLSYCGAGARLSGFTTFVINMAPDQPDVVVMDVPVADMRALQCDDPGYVMVVGGETPDVASLNAFDPQPPRASTFNRLTIPAERARDPDCLEGRRLAHRVVAGDFTAFTAEPRGAFNDLTRLRNLCFNAEGQALMRRGIETTVTAAETTAVVEEARRAVLGGVLRRPY